MYQSILVITDRNVAAQGGEWQLMCGRAIAMFDACGIRTHFVVVRPEKRMGNLTSITNHDAYSLEPVPSRGFYDLYQKLLKTLRDKVQQDYLGVVFSGNLVLRGIPYAREVFSKIYIDMHADPVEFVEFENPGVGPRWFCFLYYWYFKHLLRKVMLLVDGCLVVSHPLADVVQGFGTRRVFVIPCSRVEEDFDVEITRAYYRSLWGIPKDAQVLTYSGGASRWQMLQETVQLMESLGEKLGRETWYLFLTRSISNLEDILRTSIIPRDHVIVRTVKPEEVPKALASADVGFLLRGDCRTNHAAFPNKFSEYLLAGNLILTSPGLVDPVAIASEFDVGVVIDPEEQGFPTRESLENVRIALQERNSQYKDYLIRCRLALQRINFKNTVLPLCNSLHKV